MQTKANSFFVLSLLINFLAIGGILYFYTFNKQEKKEENKAQLVRLTSKTQNANSSLKNIKLSYNLMQDQYVLNIKEIQLIVEIMDLSKQFSLLTLKTHEETKMIRLIEETRGWMAKKSTFIPYTKGMNEQLTILLTILKTNPSYDVIKDIQNTISDIVAIMLQRSLVQTNRFYEFTEDIEKSINLFEVELGEPAQ